MSAAGAVSGNGVYAEIEHQGQKLQVSQWTNDAMDAVSLAAFRKAKRMADDPQERAVLNRMYALGEFSFQAVVDDFGLDRDRDLLATFLFHLLKANQPDVTLGLCEEIIRDDPAKVIKAVSDANPRKERKAEPAPAAPTTPAK